MAGSRKHEYVHLCLTCSRPILPDEDQVKVPGQVNRYMHATYEQCQEAMRPRPRSARETVKVLPTLDEIEQQRDDWSTR